MAKKGDVPAHVAASARAALELFAKMVSDETGVPLNKINPHVAKRLNTTPASISKVRTGIQSMQLAMVLRLGEILQVTPDDILYRAGNAARTSRLQEKR